ncbi:PAS domain S-box protein [Desulforamulus hydrothermalis]|uniref:histidine kinase n=1 Tax=Desulforamulus hydrothermalis Lam5 = DSM 18033 TaxID=1121428 RepID=K8EK65_9FIRM|nr:PAS domain S-box protein [Desulforamulus hydrothermalis]CCO08936.1 putative Signal transduction histidine kinase,nitrogen specific, NtrB [Desulforamulus hydrothermalis Lam5 = DSM 18033]SHG75174.1 PAS domain S-box-containing protein [Desulforamulus hydrothermalis Lam5 = DSM 18033]
MKYQEHAQEEIAARLRALEEENSRLKNENDILNSIIEQATDGIVLVDQQGLIIKWNQEMERLTGLPKPEVLGQPALAVRSRIKQGPNSGRPGQGRMLEQMLNGRVPLNKQVIEQEITAGNQTLTIQDMPFSITTDKGSWACGVIRDITALKQIQAKLQEQLVFMQQVLDTVPCPIFYKDLAGVYKGCNKAFEEFTGLPRTAVIGKTVFDLYPKDAARLYGEKDSELINNHGIQKYESIFKHADGSLRHVIFQKALYCDHNGQAQGIVGVCLDITEETRLAKELVRANEELTRLLESICDGFVALDQQLRFIYLNQAAKQIFSKVMATGDLIGKSALGSHPCFTAISQKLHYALANQVPVHFETFAVNKWIEIHCYPAGPGLSVFFRDVTAQKNTELALASSEERFYKIFNNSPFPMAITDLHTNKILSVNSKFLELTEYRLGEVLGRTFQDLNLWVNPDRRQMVINRLLETGRLYNFELEIRSKSGKIITGLFSAQLLNFSGQTHVLSICNDITEFKQYQKEMARLERLNIIGQMAGTLAHEVRQPLTSLKGFLQLLGSNEMYHRHKHYFDFMQSEIDRINDIITNFLALAKNKPAELRPYKLNLIIEELFPLLQADALNFGVNLILEPSDTPWLLLDRREIHQLILNLVRNGLEATETGKQVTVGTYVEDDRVVLFVKDQGKGIDPSLLDKLGTPFVTTKPEGTGLGLATCYSIAERHRAAVAVDTSPAGTAFYVKFNIPSE